MPKIHPTAIVDEQAELGEDVEVGPFCVIEGRVELGPRCRLLHRVSLKGPLRMDADNVVYPGACLGYEPQDYKFDPAEQGPGMEVGSGNIFREGVTIHRATGDVPTRIGSGCMFMVNSHVGHDCVVGDNCVLVNGALVAGHATIHDRAILSGNSAVHQHCRVGRFALLMGGTVVTQDLPPFCLTNASRSVAGINRVGLRRAGLGAHATAVKQAFDILYRQRHTPAEAARVIEQKLGDDPLCAELAAFVRSSKRGITPLRSRDKPTDV